MQYSELGKFIRLKREKLGLSLNKFANLADVDPAILCRVENLKQGIKLSFGKYCKSYRSFSSKIFRRV